jgi:hypothetical protein
VTRKTKTHQQRAQEALTVEENAVKRLATKRDRLRKDLDEVQADLEAAVVRRDYRAKSPDLADPAQMSIPVDGVGGEES